MISSAPPGYRYRDALPACSHDYLLPLVLKELEAVRRNNPLAVRLFDLGCGNGSVANILSNVGWEVWGVDPSIEGIAQARKSYPNLRLEVGSGYEDLAALYGQFPVVTSLEVVEHVYSPRQYASTLFDLLEDGGIAIVSTPFHGYFKNLVLAFTGRMDAHFTALWDNGHIKFWSVKTLTMLLREAGFKNIRFSFAGRIPILAKSMVAVAQK